MPPVDKRRRSQTSVLAAQQSSLGWVPCLLTWYDPALGGVNSSHGQRDPHAATASGEPYDASKDTCAAPSQYAFGTMVTFSYQGRTVTCRVNDRGGAITGAHFDLSRHAAETLGTINSGVVNAQFKVGAVGGAPPNAAQGNPASAGSGGGNGGGADLLTILHDFLTLNIQDLALQLGLATVAIGKTVVMGVADWIVIPWWHWNQRAVDYYTHQELFSNESGKGNVILWTSAFWGFGYYLFFTDPNAKNLKPAEVRHSRASRHVRALQGVPARRSLIKPRDVQAKTLRKPAPVVSTAEITQTGTMQAQRTSPVRVTGTHGRRNGTETETAIQRTGTLRTGADATQNNGAAIPPAKSDTQH